MTEDPEEVARKAEADYVVAGSVRRDGNRVRTNIQLTQGWKMRCLWTESFDREMAGIFDLQDEISRLVSARIATELGLTEQHHAARHSRRNLGAWELYQLGLADFYRFTGESNQRCQRLMRQAMAQDPGFGSPYARLAYAMVLDMVYFDGVRSQACLDEALALACRAIALDDHDAASYFSLGRVRLARCEYGAAIDALEEASRLNPCHALSYCGLGDSLAYEGRLAEAIEMFQTAIDLSPHDPFRWAFMSYRALAHLFAEDFQEAAAWARRATQVPNAHYWANANLVSALGHLGVPEAHDAAEALVRSRAGFSLRFARDRLFYVKNPAQLDLFLEGLRRAGIR
jgi:tetratricopeptide (TPR) repeat protein